MENTIVNIERSNLEELDQELKCLNNKLLLLKHQSKGLQKDMEELSISKSRNFINLQNCEKRIFEIECIVTSEYIFDDPTISQIPDFHLLSINELKVITKCINTTDYTNYGSPRIKELKSVITFVLQIKKLYPTWKLDMLRIKAQYGSFLPKNLYEYRFLTPEGIHFIYEYDDSS